MRAARLSTTFWLTLLLAAAPALAVENLTGRWEGVMKCAMNEGGAPWKRKEPITVEIVDEGAAGVRLELPQIGRRFTGFVVALAPKPQIGILSGASCDFSPGTGSGTMVQGPVKTKPGSTKGSLKLIWLSMDDAADVTETCVVSAKRTGTTAEVDPCTF